MGPPLGEVARDVRSLIGAFGGGAVGRQLGGRTGGMIGSLTELQSPLDLVAFITEVPSGMEADVYAASLLPITVDTASEVEYLQRLGEGLGLSSQQTASIHEALGVR